MTSHSCYQKYLSDEHSKNMKLKIILISISATLAITIIAGYAYFQSKDILTGPKIQISYPESGISLEKELLELTGTAKNIAQININDRQIFINDKGEFGDLLLLQEGYNIIKLSASDKFGRETEQLIKINLLTNK